MLHVFHPPRHRGRRADPVGAGRPHVHRTFGHLYPPQDLQAFLEEAYTVERQRVILAHPDYAVWLLELDGEAVGHAAAGPCGLPHPDVKPGDGELKRLYLIKTQQAAAGAAACWNRAGLAGTRGPAHPVVGRVVGELRRTALLRPLRFEKAGEYLFPVGDTNDLEFILRRAPRAA